MQRSRWVYAGWIAVVIAAGLVSRSGWGRGALPEFVRDYAGDTLWALMVFLGLGLLFPRVRTGVLALAALGISFAVEFSQLYQAEWIDGIRATRMGGLVLGRGWVATDLICYAVGVALGVVGRSLLVLSVQFSGKAREGGGEGKRWAVSHGGRNRKGGHECPPSLRFCDFVRLLTVRGSNWGW